MRTITRYALTLLLLVLAACLLLYLAGLVPQQAVQGNLSASMDQLVSEGFRHGVLYQGHPRSTLDNYSEAQILLRSYYMDTRADPLSILTNPSWDVDGSGMTDFEQMAQYREAVDGSAPANSTYARYWMGFRAVVRPLLALQNYMDTRQLILWAFLLLLCACALLLYRRTGSLWLPLLFVFAVSQLNPAAITASVQFSTCFFLAFTGMLLLLALPQKRLDAPLLFLILGAATQYFDFYTAPLLVFGLPALALLLRLQYAPGADFSLKTTRPLMLRFFAAWVCAYVLMWLAKLALTSLLTPVDAFASAFERVRMWIVEPLQTGGGSDIPRALFYCAINLVDVLPLVAEGVFVLVCAVCAVRRRTPRAVLVQNLVYLIIGLLPLVWIATTAKPSLDHAYFQYRGLGVTLCAGLIYLLNISFPRTER